MALSGYLKVTVNFHFSYSKDTHGTKIILKLKKDASEFLDNFRLKSIINKYSDHISIPILMEKEEWDKDKNKMISTGEKKKLIMQLHYGPVQRIKLKKISMKSLQVFIL